MPRRSNAGAKRSTRFGGKIANGAVTEFGIEARDGTYTIKADRLAENIGHAWPAHICEKAWVDQNDFCTAWLVRPRHARGFIAARSGPGRDSGIVIPRNDAMSAFRKIRTQEDADRFRMAPVQVDQAFFDSLSRKWGWDGWSASSCPIDPRRAMPSAAGRRIASRSRKATPTHSKPSAPR